MDKTNNYNLNILKGNHYGRKEYFNENFNIIDRELKDNSNKFESLSSRIEEINLPSNIGGLQPHNLRNVKIRQGAEYVRAVDVFDGYVWGYKESHIYRRKQEGGNWEQYTSAVIDGINDVMRILPTSDGEVILTQSYKVFKSNGWVTKNPTWDLKVEANQGTTFLRWGFDGYKDKFIITSYAAGGGFNNSRYAHISTDGGDTWQIVYDSVEIHGTELANESHMHAAAYDRYSDRFYLCEGHGEIAGIYCSEDDGTTWNRAEGMILDPAPTVVVPTPEGLVCGTDSKPNGMYGVVRQGNPMNEELVLTWEWKTIRDGLIGFAQRGFYDDNSGLTYIGFRSNFPDIPPIIAAGTTLSAGMVYEWKSGGKSSEDSVTNVIVPNKKEILGTCRSDKTYVLSGEVVGAGVNTSAQNTGNIEGGMSDQSTSVAVGVKSSVIGSNSIAIGTNSVAKSDGIAIGKNAMNDGFGIAIGKDVKGSPASMVMGNGANGNGLGNVVFIGQNSTGVNGGESIAIGANTSTGPLSVNIGHNSMNNSGSAYTVAIGHNTKSHTNSIAIGRGVETTTNNQFAFGNRHILFGNIEEQDVSSSVIPEGKTALFTRINDEGKLEFCIQFSGSEPIILAAQP